MILWDLLMLQLLRPNSSNLPCLYSTFRLEYPLVLSRFCLIDNMWPMYIHENLTGDARYNRPFNSKFCVTRLHIYKSWAQLVLNLSCFPTLSFEHPSVLLFCLVPMIYQRSTGIMIHQGNVVNPNLQHLYEIVSSKLSVCKRVLYQ